MDPLNYQFADPTAAIINGVKLGAVQTQLEQQQQLQQAAIAQQAQQQADLRALALNPNASHADYAAMMTKYPQLAENLGKAFKVMDDGQQKGLLDFTSRVYAANLAGNNELAAKLLEERAKADPSQAQHYSTMADLVRKSPGAARSVLALSLAGAMGPDKFASTFQNLGTEARADQMQPVTLAKNTADAVKAQAEAGNAPTAIALGNEKDRQTILSAEAQRRVADFDAQIKAANSETERQKLQLDRDKFVAEQQQRTATQGQAAQDAQDSATAALETLNGIKTHPGMQDNILQLVTGSSTKPGTMWGEVFKHMPGTDRQALETHVDSLKSQLALGNLMAAKAASPTGASGFGALSEGELKLLSNVVANLDTKSEDFPKQLAVVERFLRKTQAKAVARPSLPTTGGAFVMRHPQFGNVSEGDINRLMQQNPGATREQVLEYLRSTGGN